MWRILAALALLVGLVLAGRAYTLHCQLVGYQRAVAEYAAQAKAVDAQREAVSAPIVAKEATAQVQIRTITKTLVRKINTHVPIDSCPLPAGFGRLHDAAATNADVSVSDAASESDDSAIPVADAIERVIENYGIANSNAERLRGLQEWVRAQEALNSR